VNAIRRLAAVAAVLVYALIVLGAVVRATNSGLSCPDWPTCYGHWLPLPSDLEAIPNLGYTYGQVMLEWVHRLVAGVLLGPLVLVLAFLALRHRRARPGLLPAGAALAALLLVQAALGGVTVLDRNSPWSVALHLGTALLVLTATLRLHVLAADRLPQPGNGRVGRLAMLAWGLALPAMLSAAMTAKSGATLACATWPACDGALVPDLVDPLVRIHFIHRVLAFAVGLAVLGLWFAGRRAEDAGVRRLTWAALLLVLVQIGLGGLVILLEAPIAAAVLHQAVGVLTFAILTLLMWRCLPLARPAAAHPEGGSDGLALRRA
jgi:heme A synthase